MDSSNITHHKLLREDCSNDSIHAYVALGRIIVAVDPLTLTRMLALG